MSSENLSGPYIYFALMTPLWELEHYKKQYSREGLNERDFKGIPFLYLVLETFEYLKRSST